MGALLAPRGVAGPVEAWSTSWGCDRSSESVAGPVGAWLAP